MPGGGNNNIPSQIKLDIWDTTGQEQYANLVKSFYAGTHAVIFVYSIESMASFKELYDVHMNAFLSVNSNPNVVKVIVGNKCDLENERRVSFEELQ